MSDLRQLRHDHAELLEVTGRLSQLVAAPTPPPFTTTAELGRELTATLMPLLQIEDEKLLPRLMASGDPAAASTARRFSDEMGGLASAYRLYAQRWGTMFIAVNWSGYCHETRAIIDAVTNRIARGRRELYPLLESLDQAA